MTTIHTTPSPARSRRIRQKRARLAAIEAEAKQLLADLLPLEAQESWSMGYQLVLRGDKLLEAMDRRDAGRVAA
jgi:hypothetical protein